MWIRRFEDGDAIACAALFHRAVREGAAERYSPAARRAWSPDVPEAAKMAAKLGAQHCVVADDGALQGFMSLAPDGYLDMAFVAPEARGKGIAAQLYAMVLNHAHGLGLRRLTTHASLYAQPFFSRHGWHIEAPETISRDGVKIRRFRMFIHLSG